MRVAMAVLEDREFSEGASGPDRRPLRRDGAGRSIAWMFADLATSAPRDVVERLGRALRRWWGK
jgi:hypothetical protein